MTNRSLRNFLLLLVALAMLVLPAAAQGRGEGKGHQQKGKNHMEQNEGDQGQGHAENRDEGDGEKNHQNGKRHGRVQAKVPLFGPRDRDIITGYYRNRYSNLPPGLAKRGGDLPPGLQRQLDRNGTLPPGLQKRLEPFPQELSRQLPPLPVGYSRGVIGTDVVVINQRTRAIVDLIHIVLNR